MTVSFPASASPHRIRVALFVDRGASERAKKNFEKEFKTSDEIFCTPVYGDDIKDGVLANFDALIVPGGSAKKEAFSMGPEARDEVRRFVREGGIYMGVCAGAYLSSEANEKYLGLLPVRTVDQEHWFRVARGTPVDVELTPLGMEVLGIDQQYLKIVYENGPIFAPPAGAPDNTLTPLGFYRSEVVARGGRRGVMRGAPVAVLSKYGNGIVLAISPHPELTPGLRRKELHALHWLYDHRNDGSSPVEHK